MIFVKPGRLRGAGRPSARAAGLSAILLVVGAGALLAGCSASNPHPTGSFERAAFFADQGKDLQAVGAFETFVRQNPTDSLAAEAQYRKAVSYMEMKEYPLAAVEFQILRKDYPTSDRVEDALFEEAKAYLFQVGRVERDVTGAYEARLKFLEFSQTYPNSAHMPEVVGYMQEISDLMVRKRLEQIKVYKQFKRYTAVAVVLDGILAEEPASSLVPEVMWERAKVAERLDDPDTAEDMYRQLISRDPEGHYGKRADKALRKLDEAEDDGDEDQ